MTDGYNHARAMRVSEVMTDYRNVQHYMAQINAPPSPEDANLEGYAILRACIHEAQAVLATPYSGNSLDANGDEELEKAQLQAVLLDAIIRRFKCQRAYLRACACIRWINARNAVLRGSRPRQSHLPALQAADQALYAELAAISDEHVEYVLRAQDTAQGKWLAEDYSLTTIQPYL
ncbi:hypothetical protein K402DRAFT_412114 [Aulographum hederae CBS 113979]|uniref:Uncharacterized protein n=1 Tax=Aulographum hederae CBS 113979 TaxID=1176131 RepID=A0A6G1H2M1_9PEZI|nr:hypothetical protein K402DRAFT_412114 [Aulographum hederae CBS 113979]